MSVRKASLPNDAESILSLLRYIDLSVYPKLTDIENPDDQWFVYREKGEIVGCVAARRTTCEIRHIVILPNHQRKGIGTQLANSAIELLGSIGCSRIWVQIRLKNEKSQRLFEKLGFKREPRLIRSRKNPEVMLYSYVLTR